MASALVSRGAPRDDRGRPAGDSRFQNSRDDRGRPARDSRDGERSGFRGAPRDDRGRPAGDSRFQNSRDDRGRPARDSRDGERSGFRGAPRDDRGRPAGDSRFQNSRDDRGRPARDSRGSERSSSRTDFRGGRDRTDARSTGAPARGTGTSHYSAERAERRRHEQETYEATRGSRPTRGEELAVPADADPRLLDPSVRSELRSLSKVAAEIVAGHLVAAGRLIDTDPKRALDHARAARGRGARVGAVREATGLAAYHAGEWAEALSELRAARRISGDASNMAAMADCERALGRPERALKVFEDPAYSKLDPATKAEVLIVVAGARRDMGQLDAALAVLERGHLDASNPRPGSARLWYAYADALAEAGRTQEAIQWFGAAAGVDFEDETDAADRAADLL